MCVQVNINNSSPHENVHFTYLVEEEGGGPSWAVVSSANSAAAAVVLLLYCVD